MHLLAKHAHAISGVSRLLAQGATRLDVLRVDISTVIAPIAPGREGNVVEREREIEARF